MANLTCQLPFTVVRDHREIRAGWTFENVTLSRHGRQIPVEVKVETRYMKTADYSIAGYEGQFAIERKARADLAQTLTRGRRRFVAELERLEEFDFSAVVVESTWLDFIKHVWTETEGMPAALDESLLALTMRYPTRWFFRPDAAAAEKTALKLMIRFLKDREVKI